MRGAVLVAAMIVLPAAQADDGADAGDVTQAVNFFGNCAGVWDFLSDVAQSEGKSATAEQLHNMGNGAQTAALWLLANKHSIDTGKATTYGSWMDLVQPRRESGRLRMHALTEQSSFDTVSAESNACLEAASEQESILQMMRNDRVRQAQEAVP